uniref:Uncharacterized protein n=1 Tax=Arundo donax TaxID=35708 RepID=A0A0A9DYG2_ARUDO
MAGVDWWWWFPPLTQPWQHTQHPYRHATPLHSSTRNRNTSPRSQARSSL